jgi:hypothetical protein
MTAADAGGQLSLAQDIRPLFRDKDREPMKAAFDLFDDQDVASHGAVDPPGEPGRQGGLP